VRRVVPKKSSFDYGTRPTLHTPHVCFPSHASRGINTLVVCDPCICLSTCALLQLRRRLDGKRHPTSHRDRVFHCNLVRMKAKPTISREWHAHHTLIPYHNTNFLFFLIRIHIFFLVLPFRKQPRSRIGDYPPTDRVDLPPGDTWGTPCGFVSDGVVWRGLLC